jgi:tRNA A37 methylthiotransferase MiaB
MFNFPRESWDEFRQSVELARHFDDCVFIGYGENSRTRAAAILPKCGEAERRRKVEHLEALGARGELRAFVVPCP